MRSIRMLFGFCWWLHPIKVISFQQVILEFFTICISAKSSRSIKSKSLQVNFDSLVLQVLNFYWGIQILTKVNHLKYLLPITCKVWILRVMIYKNSILYLSDLTELSDLVFFVKNQPGPPSLADGSVYLSCLGFRVQYVTGA